MTTSDWDLIRQTRENGSRADLTKVLLTVGREFADAFGETWWSMGLPGAIAGGVEWTLHIDDMGIGDARIDLLYLAGSDPLTGYFFTGGRLLVDRLSDVDCDIYVSRGATPRVRGTTAKVIRVGTEGFEGWHAIASHISELARR